MKKVLYVASIEVPYRTRFFNELAKKCDLTVLYERKKSTNRDAGWAKSVQENFRVKYLRGINIGREQAFSLGILAEIFRDYDHIILGCFNSPAQMLAILILRLFRKPFILNLDGETFLEGTGYRTKLKKLFLTGAEKYFVAGEKSAESLRRVFPDKPIVPYYFSSVTEAEIAANSAQAQQNDKDTILVVGQYLDYKGLDVALKAAAMDQTLHYKFVGMGSRTELFLQEQEIPDNVETVAFLQKAQLEEEYRSCQMLVLPSRKECWGLVVNEAASFGLPIVSTWGSGAAVEFLSEEYPQYLAEPDNPESLLQCIYALRESNNKEAYQEFLRNKTKQYSIERSVEIHLAAM